ncbi:MAG TPA: hypothetical protein VIS72_01080 [Anaerolineales bacterium]
MNIKTSDSRLLFLLSLSLVEVMVFLIFVLTANRTQDGTVRFSPTAILMVCLGVFLLLVFAIFCFQALKGNSSILTLRMNEALSNSSRFSFLQETLSLAVVFTITTWFFLLIAPADIGDYLGQRLIIRLAQYLPVAILFAVLSVQCLYLFRSSGLPSPRFLLSFESKWSVAILLFVFCFLLYFSTSRYLEQLYTPRIAFFPQLAQAFLDGKTYLVDPHSVKDLSLFNNKYYVSFPPLAAILMMPAVKIGGSDAAVNTALWNTVFASLGVAFIFLALGQLVVLGWSKLSRRDNLLLALFLGFGTVQYFMSIRGPVYYISQILTASLLSTVVWVGLLKYEHKKTGFHGLITGMIFGLALLARPNVVFASLALFAFQYQKYLDDKEVAPLQKSIRWAIWFSIPVLIAVTGLAWYNNIRFGSVMDFGYKYMDVVDPVLLKDLQEYEQFHPHFILRNIRDNFLRLPEWYQNCGRLAPNPRGMSIFLVSPLIVYLYNSFIKKPWIWGAWLSVVAILTTHLLYFNSGALQFGYRFSLDFMPLIILLLAVSLKERMNKTAFSLLCAGFGVNFVGALWIARAWCENW